MRVPSLRAQQLQPPKPGASLATLSLVSLAAALVACADHRSPTAPASGAAPALEALLAGAPLNVPAQGQYIFRHWTFGAEPFWTDTLHLVQVEGVGPEGLGAERPVTEDVLALRRHVERRSREQRLESRGGAARRSGWAAMVGAGHEGRGE